jgi:hypothetical protein
MCVFFIVKGNENKVNKDMNSLFMQCPELRRTHVQQFEMLKCVHVHWHGEEEIDHSLFCDPDFKSMAYAGEADAIIVPRYSGIQYKFSTLSTESVEGKIVGIVSYKPKDLGNHLFLLVNRFCAPIESEYFKRALPQRLVKYHKTGAQVTTDCIPISNVTAPLFVVPSLDFDLTLADFGTRAEVNGRFYVITEAKVYCKVLRSYDKYIDENNTRFSEMRGSNENGYLNFNPFLSIHDMAYIKDALHVLRNIEEYDNDVVEDYDFNFIEEDNDGESFTL